MHRVLIMAYSLVFFLPTLVWTQVTSVRGDLRYQHQFQDALGTAGTYSRYSQRIPQLSLMLTGYAVTPQLASYNLQTYVIANSGSYDAAGVSYGSRQLLLNYYNFSGSLLQNLPIRVRVAARDGESESITDRYRRGEPISKTRLQQQDVTLATNNIPFLPSMQFSYLRSKSWSLLPWQPSDQLQQTYSLSMSRGTKTSSVSVNGSLQDLLEHTSGRRTQIGRTQFRALRQLHADHRTEIASEYVRYDAARGLSGSIGYTGRIDDRLSLTSTMSGNMFTTTASNSLSLSLGQGVSFRHTESFSYSLSLDAQRGRDVYTLLGNPRRIVREGYGTRASVQHNRTVGSVAIGNGVSLGYSEYTREGNRRSISGSVNNSAQTVIHNFTIHASYSLGASRSVGYLSQTEMNQYGILQVSGFLPHGIRSETTFDYRDDQRLSEDVFSYRSKAIRLQERLLGSFYYHIPIHAVASGSIHWVRNGVTGRYYSLSISLVSNRFFVEGLGVGYSLSRGLEFGLGRAVLEQTLNIQYQWRMLTFSLRGREHRSFERRREVLFTAVRPLNFY